MPQPKKRTTRKSNRSKAIYVRSGGANKTKLSVSLLQMAIFVMAFAVIGTWALIFTHADSITGSNCGSTVIKKSTGGYWTCSFDEEFNGTTYDTKKWVAITTAASGFSSRKQDCLTGSSKSVFVAGGYLNLKVQKEAAPFICRSQNISYTTQYTSADLSTYTKFSQTYGRFEIRAKVPNVKTKGLQESFWLWPDKPIDQDPGYYPWPSTGEIDIAEVYHRYPDRAIPILHYYLSALGQQYTNNYCMIDISQFHNYLLEWTPQVISIYIDGKLCMADNWNPHAPQVKAQPFNKPYFINLTAGLGISGNAFDPSTTPLPAITQVDYVRVWK